jgi:protein arginine N-methyltransferase 1
MTHPLKWHRQMLTDQARVEGLAKAIGRAVQPGDVVLDLGAGTGLLSFLACRCNAARVYAAEQGPIADLARELAAINGLADRVTVLHDHSTRVALPEPVDLILSETLGSFGLEEDLLENLEDVRQRLLRPGGRLLPDRLQLWAAPTEESPDLGGWTTELEQRWGLSLAPLELLSRHLTGHLRAAPERLLAEPRLLVDLDLYQRPPATVAGTTEYRVQRRGVLAGWVGWFSAWFQGEAFLSTAPPIRFTSWDNAFFPVAEPVTVEPGEVLEWTVERVRPFFRWRTRVPDQGIDETSSDFLSHPPSTFRPPVDRPDREASE